MLLKGCMYLILIALILAAIPMLFYSIFGRTNKKYPLILNTVFIIYLIVINVCLIMLNPFEFDYNLGLLYSYICSPIAGAIYLIAAIVCIVKMKKKELPESRKVRISTILLTTLPILLFFVCWAREWYLIQNSNVIVTYEVGSGFNSESFAYAINENYCEEISIGA